MHSNLQLNLEAGGYEAVGPFGQRESDGARDVVNALGKVSALARV